MKIIPSKEDLEEFNSTLTDDEKLRILQTFNDDIKYCLGIAYETLQDCVEEVVSERKVDLKPYQKTRKLTEYQKTVADFLKREELTNLSPKDLTSSPYFSWANCECCDSEEGGYREDCNGHNPLTKEISGSYSICNACIHYLEYGQLGGHLK